MNLRSATLPILLLLVAGCASNRSATETATQIPDEVISTTLQVPLSYRVDLNDRSDDTFKVTLSGLQLGPDNAIYQFASTAPGTYQVMDVGRFVRSFVAFATDGSVISSEQVSTNQWKLSQPESVSEIRYEVAETWDTPVDEHRIYMMAGTSIEDDHVLINGQAVFGFPVGMQDRPLHIQLDYPNSWKVGTALDLNDAGSYVADDYDHVVDSPVLLGRLSTATLDVKGTDVEIYTYSKTDRVESGQIMDAVRNIFFATADFLGELPVDRYAFLFHFEDMSMGAWEHSYSSEYVFSEADFDQIIGESIPSIVAHEFFHIVTPLNIHSEIVDQFNFAKPVPSEHLWLYEGTTEWASDALQLRAGLIDIDNYLGRMSEKLSNDDQYDADYSLSKLGLTSFESEGQAQYANIYQRGAVVSALLDIRLLELSQGQRGLREVLNELSQKYGPDRPFDESTFFDTFVEMTHPEIRDFFDSYVRNAETLPVPEYYQLLGIQYTPSIDTGETTASMGLQIVFSESKLVFSKVDEPISECGFEPGDELVGYNGQDVNLGNVQEVFAQTQTLDVGDEYNATIRRDGIEETFTCSKYAKPKIDRHVFNLDPDATAEQLALRTSWMTNSGDGRKAVGM